jgi:enediyne biosynthesis protein E4
VNPLSKKLSFLAGVLLFVIVCLWLMRFARTPFPWERTESRNLATNPAEQSAWLEARENEADKTIWAKEMLAQSCGRTFESLWDAINASTNKLGLIAEFSSNEIVLGQWGPPESLPHGIELRQTIGSGPILSRSEWRQWVQQLRHDGWQLDNIEFRHDRFDTDQKGQPWKSSFYFAARLTNPMRRERAMLEGDLVVDWAAKQPHESSPSVKRLDASRLKLKTMLGEPLLQPILQENITPHGKSALIDPLILYDLDGDGLSEIILAAANLVYRRDAEGRYRPEPLCRFPVDFITSAVVADFDRDGVADFLCANTQGLLLFKGSAQPTFHEPGRLVWAANPLLKNATVLTCGDIDQDGDLDLFLGQYRNPDLGQVLRPYYYDANDSFPSYLLLNQGQGTFTNVTETAGLGPKRWRRAFSASLADLDGDSHLDLVVVSDFAGIDAYRNDSRGHFTDVTPRWFAEPHGFGMAHALADFNADGRLDLLMIGMPSPTVNRLEHLGLWRHYSDDDRRRRSAMTFGNRLYLARPEGGFEQTTLNDSIARSGWSWGCSAFDFDNDGFQDVYIANGLQSKQSVRDYESEFWLHDIFIDESIDDRTASSYLIQKFSRTRGDGWSYGGYEKNRLFLNQQGKSFIEIGHLAGVALEQDSRNVAADDLDGDGRLDLLVTTLEAWPAARQTLQVYRNTLTHVGHWIGFQFQEQVAGVSPVGARVTIRYNGQSATRQIVTGDSHRSQHSNAIHFGLGTVDRVDGVEILWSNGSVVTLSQPGIDRFHVARPPTETRVPENRSAQPQR